MLQIREASDDDFDGIWEVFREVVRRGDTYPFAPDTGREEAYRIWMAAPTATYAALEVGRIVGTYYIKPNQPSLGAHICNAGYMVREDARGRGVGRAMCAHSLRAARSLGFRAMQYNFVVSSNEPAVELWKDLGFEIIGTIPDAFRHAELGLVSAHIMYRSLEDVV